MLLTSLVEANRLLRVASESFTVSRVSSNKAKWKADMLREWIVFVRMVHVFILEMLMESLYIDWLLEQEISLVANLFGISQGPRIT